MDDPRFLMGQPPTMKCGHVANAAMPSTGAPVCATCADEGILDALVIVE